LTPFPLFPTKKRFCSTGRAKTLASKLFRFYYSENLQENQDILEKFLSHFYFFVL